MAKWIVEQRRNDQVVFRSEPMGSRAAEEMAEYLNRHEPDYAIVARVRKVN